MDSVVKERGREMVQKAQSQTISALSILGLVNDGLRSMNALVGSNVEVHLANLIARGYIEVAELSLLMESAIATPGAQPLAMVYAALITRWMSFIAMAQQEWSRLDQRLQKNNNDLLHGILDYIF